MMQKPSGKGRTRLYSSNIDQAMSALNHPVRSSLHNLIQQGVETIHEMSDLLGENRINLYHHLSSLEKAGLVRSSFNNNRIKIYKIVNQANTQPIQQVDEMAILNDNVLTTTIIAFPKVGKEKEFQRKLRDLIKEATISREIMKNMNAIHIQIVFQDKQIIERKQELVKKMMKSR